MREGAYRIRHSLRERALFHPLRHSEKEGWESWEEEGWESWDEGRQSWEEVRQSGEEGWKSGEEGWEGEEEGLEGDLEIMMIMTMRTSINMGTVFHTHAFVAETMQNKRYYVNYSWG